MTRIKYVLLTAVLLMSCTQEELTVRDIQPEITKGNKEAFVSKVTGQKFSANSVEAKTILVKFDDTMVVEIEKCNGNVDEILPLTKSADHPLRKVTPVKMERLFPHAGEFEARTREAGLHKWYKMSLDEAMSLPDAEVLLADATGLEVVEFSPIPKANFDRRSAVAYPTIPMGIQTDETYIFDDPKLPDQWHYYNDGSKKGMVAGSDIDVLSVWEDYTPGSSDVIVSIVDGGIDVNHEDLKDNLWMDERTGVYGYNFVSGSNNITADDHGTHVAGTVGAINNNKIGVSGVAGGDKGRGVPGVRLMSCQIFEGENGAGGANAIKWGADHGAVISQNSWGYEEEVTTVFQHDRDAIDYFVKYAGYDKNGNQVGPMAGGVVIFAAGNEDRNIGSPSMYDGCIAVAAIGADYQRGYYSNYGKWVDICAPGGDAYKGYEVLSTLPGNRYGRMQGTSMACPHVSGVAALIVSNLGGPGFTAESLKEVLLNAVNEEVLKYNQREIGLGLVSAKNCISGDRAIEHLVALEVTSPISMKAGKVREIPVSIKNPTGHDIKFVLTPEVEGVTIEKISAKKLVITLDGPTIMKDNWKEDKSLDFHLSVTCEKEPGEEHTLDFKVNIAANQSPYLIKDLDGMVVNQLGKSTKIALDKHFFDPDADELKYSISESSLGKFKMTGNQVTFTADKFGQEEIEVTASDAFNEEFTARFTLLVRDGNARSLDIYPNPVTDGNLYIRGSEEMDLEIKIYSATGKCVYEDNMESTPFAPAKVDMSGLPGGTYTVKVKADDDIEMTQNIAKI